MLTSHSDQKVPVPTNSHDGPAKLEIVDIHNKTYLGPFAYKTGHPIVPSAMSRSTARERLSFLKECYPKLYLFCTKSKTPSNQRGQRGKSHLE